MDTLAVQDNENMIFTETFDLHRIYSVGDAVIFKPFYMSADQVPDATKKGWLPGVIVGVYTNYVVVMRVTNVPHAFYPGKFESYCVAFTMLDAVTCCKKRRRKDV